MLTEKGKILITNEVVEAAQEILRSQKEALADIVAHLPRTYAFDYANDALGQLIEAINTLDVVTDSLKLAQEELDKL